MRHQKKLAAAMACALALSLCAGHVLADGTADPIQQVEAPLIVAPAPTEAPPSQVPETTTVQPVFSAAPTARKAFIVEGSGAPAAADAPGTVSFENLGPRMLEHNDIRWITVEEIDQYPFCPADEEILVELKKRNPAH